jgi:hypothetical protein
MHAVAFLGGGSIWLPTGLHFAWNFFQGPVLGFPVSGLEMGGLVQQIPVGSDLVTGGGYGPEAGLVGMTFRFVAIGLLMGWQAFRPGSVGSGAANERLKSLLRIVYFWRRSEMNIFWVLVFAAMMIYVAWWLVHSIRRQIEYEVEMALGVGSLWTAFLPLCSSATRQRWRTGRPPSR